MEISWERVERTVYLEAEDLGMNPNFVISVVVL